MFDVDSKMPKKYRVKCFQSTGPIRAHRRRRRRDAQHPHHRRRSDSSDPNCRNCSCRCDLPPRERRLHRRFRADRFDDVATNFRESNLAPPTRPRASRAAQIAPPRHLASRQGPAVELTPMRRTVRDAFLFHSFFVFFFFRQRCRARSIFASRTRWRNLKSN